MPLDATARRRWFGVLVLLGALILLLAGQTILRHRLSGMAFLLYWLLCLGLTLLAIVIAVLDASALQRRTRQENRDLLQKALDEIAAEARQRRSPPPGKRQP